MCILFQHSEHKLAPLVFYLQLELYPMEKKNFKGKMEKFLRILSFALLPVRLSTCYRDHRKCFCASGAGVYAYLIVL